MYICTYIYMHTFNKMTLPSHLVISVLIIIAAISSCYGEGTLATTVHLASGIVFNVDDFGAKGDGKADNSQAFSKAWQNACSSSSGAVLIVPSNGNYLLKPITFSGPCRSPVTIQIRGKIFAWSDAATYNGTHWILFSGVQNLAVEGHGTIDGNGQIWWKNSCKINKNLIPRGQHRNILVNHPKILKGHYEEPCRKAPTALRFYGCKNLRVGNLKLQNAQQIHVSFEKCSKVKASRLKITAPENSPNTDGIHITNTHNILVQNTIIGTGDDCISIASGSQQVRALNITCGPGHGISIGSLGEDNSYAYVSDVTVNGATISRTTNGVRIKTWQGGSGFASNIKFENIKLSNVQNPIVIDQNYCDRDKPCKKQASAVQVKNVWYKNIWGTSATTTAVRFDCGENYPCQGIVMQNVDIKSIGHGRGTKAICNNVRLHVKGKVFPHC